jgi:hypothetical protein
MVEPPRRTIRVAKRRALLLGAIDPTPPFLRAAAKGVPVRNWPSPVRFLLHARDVQFLETRLPDFFDHPSLRLPASSVETFNKSVRKLHLGRG